MDSDGVGDVPAPAVRMSVSMFWFFNCVSKKLGQNGVTLRLAASISFVMDVLVTGTPASCKMREA